MADFLGYDEEKANEEKKKQKEENRKINEKIKKIVWENKKGDSVYVSYTKAKGFPGLRKRIQEECAVFGYSYGEDDYGTHKTGTIKTTYYNNGTARSREEEITLVSYFTLERDYELKDDRLVTLCNKWIKNIKARKNGVAAIIIAGVILVAYICGAITAAVKDASDNFAPFLGMIIACVPFFIVGPIRCVKFYTRKNAVTKAKEIWKDLKQKSK